MKKFLLILLLGVFIAGCSIKIKPLTLTELKQRVHNDFIQMYKHQKPVTHPVSLPEAIARALKYNLDHRVKLAEIALSQRIYDLTSYNLLPTLALDAGYNSRSKYSGGTSQSLLTGRESLEASTSQDRDYETLGLSVVWNILDFGVTHATTLQKANQIMIARERRRRVTQNMVQDVSDAYWRAVAAERLLKPIKELVAKVQEARERSGTLSRIGLQNPEIALNYQLRLLETMRQLQNTQEKLTLAKDQLAALINLPPGTSYEVLIPKNYYKTPKLPMSLKQLETKALLNQPELREEDYIKRVKKLDVKKAFIRLFPGLEISMGTEYNSNGYLYNNNWIQAGLRVTWNVLNVFTGGFAAQEEAKAQVVLADQRRFALSMAILTQVWVSYHRYLLALKEVKLSNELYSLRSKMENFTTQGAKAQVRNDLDVILAQVQTLMSLVNKDIAYADLQTSIAKIYHVIGIDPLPNSRITTHKILTSKETKKYTESTYAPDPKLTKDLPRITNAIKAQKKRATRQTKIHDK